MIILNEYKYSIILFSLVLFFLATNINVNTMIKELSNVNWYLYALTFATCFIGASSIWPFFYFLKNYTIKNSILSSIQLSYKSIVNKNDATILEIVRRNMIIFILTTTPIFSLFSVHRQFFLTIYFLEVILFLIKKRDYLNSFNMKVYMLMFIRFSMEVITLFILFSSAKTSFTLIDVILFMLTASFLYDMKPFKEGGGIVDFYILVMLYTFGESKEKILILIALYRLYSIFFILVNRILSKYIHR